MIDPGTKINKLTILKFVERKQFGRKKYEMYLCRCDCGKEKIINGHHIKTGKTVACGCGRGIKRDDSIVGEKFGKLTVLSFAHSNLRRQQFYNCICECGNEHITNKDTLKRGMVKSCGCIKSPVECGDIKRYLWSHIKHNADLRNIEFDITAQDAWEQFTKQEKKCALSNLPICLGKSRAEWLKCNASLDRIDSKKGYTKDNIQWVHKTINVMKLDLTEEEFIFFCKAITEYQSTKERESNECNT